MIELFFKLIVVSQSSFIALGVGASTLVITSFLIALKDGKIDESERRMLGVIYTALRVAMIGILVTTGLIVCLEPSFFGSFSNLLIVLLAVLFANAILMTKHWISSKVGPALQAATWYTLGFLMTINMFGLFEVTWNMFLALYVADIMLALLIVNAAMAYLKKRNK